MDAQQKSPKKTRCPPEVIINDVVDVSGAPADLKKFAIAALSKKLVRALRDGRWVSPRDGVVLSVSCVGAPAMSRLNMKYRGRRRVTDVLSFEQRARGVLPRGIVFLGDIVLCAPVVRAQAREHGHSARHESAILLAHGLLHLLGYEHEGRGPRATRAAARMARAESRLLKLAGIKKAGLITRVKV